MKFLEKLDIFKPIGKGLSEVDTFMRREMPFNMSWGFPAALTAAYFGAPYLANAVSGSSGAAGAGSMTGNSMLGNLGLDGGGSFVPTAGNSFELLSSDYTPAYLNKLAQLRGVDAGDPTLFQRLTGQTEQGLYDAQQPLDTKGLLSKLLRNQSGKKEKSLPQPDFTGYQYEDLNEPFYNRNASQQEKTRKLLAQQLRLLNTRTSIPSAANLTMRNMNLQDLFDKYGTLS